MSPGVLLSFDRICIISLPERTDRRRAAAHEMQRLGLAIDGRRIRFVDGIRPDSAGAFPSRGARGCFLSHLKALREARADGVRRLLVLEDDFMFTLALEDSAQLAQALATVPWHIAYPGHTLPALPGPLRWEPTRAPLVCAHCYAVNDASMPILIEHLEACLARPSGHPEGSPMHFDGALTVLRRNRPDLLTLRASRSLAVQRSSRSDIIGPSWLDALPLASLVRGLRNGWRRLVNTH